MTDHIIASIGLHGFHGLSAAFDFGEALSSSTHTSSTCGEPIKILLVCPGDVRHIMATIARRRRHRTGKYSGHLQIIHFYIMEAQIEVLARNILLLEILNDYEIPIRQRATVLLEVFGNVRVQDRTSRYVELLGHQLRSLVTAGTGRLEDLLDLGLLRYREKDQLEETFKSYSRIVSFDVENLRDHRLRGLYGDRYDSRKAVSDWDYHHGIKSKASIIHIKQYKEWCHSGIAFEFGDQTYTEPNRTLMSYAEGIIKKGKEKGLKKEVRGFWTDIVASPFYSFGVDCETPNSFAEGLFEIYNKNSGSEQHRHHTVEVAVYNMLSYMWEVETGKLYRMTKNHDVYSGLGIEADIFDEEKRIQEISEDEEEKVLEISEDATDDLECSSKEGSEAVALSVEDSTMNTEEGEITSSSERIDIVKEEEERLHVRSHRTTLPIDQSVVPENETPVMHDIPSISHNEPLQSNEEQARKVLEKQIQRAECIAESLDGIKIFPILGGIPSIAKTKYEGFFDGIFVSARSAQCIQQESFKNLLKKSDNDSVSGGLVAVETAKFFVPLSKKMQKDFTDREEEYATAHNWIKIDPPVFRRRRDELDLEDDVMFFRN